MRKPKNKIVKVMYFDALNEIISSMDSPNDKNIPTPILTQRREEKTKLFDFAEIAKKLKMEKNEVRALCFPDKKVLTQTDKVNAALALFSIVSRVMPQLTKEAEKELESVSKPNKWLNNESFNEITTITF